MALNWYPISFEPLGASRRVGAIPCAPATEVTRAHSSPTRLDLTIAYEQVSVVAAAKSPAGKLVSEPVDTSSPRLTVSLDPVV